MAKVHSSHGELCEMLVIKPTMVMYPIEILHCFCCCKPKAARLLSDSWVRLLFSLSRRSSWPSVVRVGFLPAAI